jgi:trans-aconitate 2-methyltransferase
MQTWGPRDYERHSAAQESWARDCIARLRLGGAERVLDIGCGDGRVSAELAAHVPAGSVLAVDSSAEMVAHAREQHFDEAGGNLRFAVADATGLTYEHVFDVVVSFSCLHWVQDQDAVLRGVARALLNGGRMFLHFAGRGNAAGMLSIVDEVSARPAWRAAFVDFGFPWCFPEAAGYRDLVEEAALHPDRVELLSRQMLHEDAAALAGWLRTTWLPYLDRLPQELRGAFVDEAVAAYLAVRPADEHGRIWVDAVRLEAEGHRA